MVFKICFVPSCPNTSDNAPNKIFIGIPRNLKRRERWFQAINIELLKDKAMVCCEDHFNLEKDAENWSYYKVIGSLLRLRKDVVPHLNIHSHNAQSTSQFSESEKKRKLERIEKVNPTKPPLFVDCSEIVIEDENDLENWKHNGIPVKTMCNRNYRSMHTNTIRILQKLKQKYKQQ